HARLCARLPAEPIAVRYDLPWESPWGDPSMRPSVRSREVRMNFGTERHRLQKAATDRLAPDTVEIDLRVDEDALLAAMRPKTRYNVRLSGRRGVRVARADSRQLPCWHELYTQTAARKGFRPQSLGYFRTLFDLATAHRPDVRLYLAYAGSLVLGGIVVVHIGGTATYLYGASAAAERSLMAPYALQWHAIAEARRAGCRRYDLFGVPPAPDAGHPMYGLYRFKTGFGGRLVHRRGAWDYVYDRESYAVYEAAEAAGSGYYTGS
ncbi:MAG: lipid II:glycine glycyltransferase FemX, partial [Spirochaetota bacterium]